VSDAPEKIAPAPIEGVALASAVFLSGAASLAYQVAWARRLTTEISATPAAQAFVVGIFMAGLGIGAAAAGWRSGSIRRPLMAYAAVELVAAGVAAASFPAMRVLGPGGAAWRMVAASGFLLLTTASLLGASLPFVLEHAQRRFVGAIAKGRLVGVLYGTNTLGAVFGALAAGFLTIERYGLRATVLMGCGLALAAAAIAAAMTGRGRIPHAEPTGAKRSLPKQSTTPGNARGLVLCATLAGLAGVGSEIVYTRLLALVVWNTVYVFAEVLAGVLIGISAGGFAATLTVKRKMRSPSALSVAVFALAAAAVLIASSPTIAASLAGTKTFDVGVPTGSFVSALAVFAIVAPPAALIALALPILVLAWRASSGARAFGLLYAANAVGSVVGSFLVGFVLLPRLGLAVAVSTMAGVAIAAGGVLLLGEDQPLAAKRPRTAWGALAAATGIVALFHVSRDIPRAIYESHLPAGIAIRDFQEGTVSDVMVTDAPNGLRTLWINSAWVAGTGGGHRLLGHLPALLVAEPQRGLGIALGTGQTFAAMLRHGLSTLDCVEINPSVIRMADRWFGDANDHLLEKPGVVVHTDDGRVFMRSTDRRFDLIVLEPLMAWSAGTANLYSREFYEEARRILNPGGVVAQWIPLYGQTELDTKAMVRAGADVFPSASLWLDGSDGILVLSNAPFVLDPEALDARMRDRGVRAILAKNGVTSAADLLALFVLGPSGIRRWTADAPIMDDDHPFLEFSAGRTFMDSNTARIFASLRDSAEDPATYFRAPVQVDYRSPYVPLSQRRPSRGIAAPSSAPP
jgi:spermidine synthase